jgi:hypothetical protein
MSPVSVKSCSLECGAKTRGQSRDTIAMQGKVCACGLGFSAQVHFRVTTSARLSESMVSEGVEAYCFYEL